MCPPLCLRGGLGRTRVTWWRGRPCVGSSDRPSQDAERDSGEEYDGTEGGGEELESSHRPDGSKKSGEKVEETRGWKHHFRFEVDKFKTIGNCSEMYWLRQTWLRLKQPLTDGKEEKRVNKKNTNGALKETGWGQSETGKSGERIYSSTHSAWWRQVVFVLFSSCAS